MSNPLVALTGGTGFVGRQLAAALPARGYRVRALLRSPATLPHGVESAVVGDLAAPRDLARALEGCDFVVHGAGLAHATGAIPEETYRRVNTEATLALAEAARQAGARRFLFLSSIRAQSGPAAEGVLTEADEPRPSDAYGRSKLAAEQGLAEGGLDWAALRPVVVYGPGVKANVAALVRLARLPVPLPFAGLTGRRSLVAVENVTGAVDVLLRREGEIRRPLIVADPDPLTLGEMIAALRAGLGRSPGLIPVPERLIAAGLGLIGRGEAFRRAAGSLVASPAALTALGWRPGVTSREGLARLAGEGS